MRPSIARGAVRGGAPARAMDAGATSRARTMLDACERLGTFAGVAGDARADGTARDGRDVVANVVILGADRAEGTSPRETATMFASVRARARACGVDTVRVLCVGPNVRVGEAYELGREYDAGERTRDEAALRVEFRAGLYHEETVERTADVAFAFNAGVWGYDPSDWHPTIERVVVRERTPLVLTSYSLREAESDEDAMRASLSGFENVMWEWEAEKNASCSSEVRELGFDRTEYMKKDASGESSQDVLRENFAWQCVAVN